MRVTRDKRQLMNLFAVAIFADNRYYYNHSSSKTRYRFRAVQPTQQPRRRPRLRPCCSGCLEQSAGGSLCLCQCSGDARRRSFPGVRLDRDVRRSQWSSGNMPDCGVRGPRFESHRGQLHVYRKNHYDIQHWARAAHPYCTA